MMEKSFSDDSSNRELDDAEGDKGMIKEEHFNTLYYIKREMGDDKNVSKPFICDDKNNLDVKPCFYNCAACTMQFTQLKALEEHFATHENDNVHVCALCDKRFLYEYHFKLHFKNYHLEKEKQNTLNKLKQEDELWRVIKEDSDNDSQLGSDNIVDYPAKPPVRDVCLKSFTHTGNLKKHELIHTSIKPQECDVCLKSFTQAGRLKQHKLIHSGIKPHVCDVCLKSFTYAGDLKKHKLIHSGIKPHVCDVCLKSFTQAAQLKQHKLIHSSIKPHVCDVCLKSFISAYGLKRHKLNHSGIKPHVYDVYSSYWHEAT